LRSRARPHFCAVAGKKKTTMGTTSIPDPRNLSDLFFGETRTALSDFEPYAGPIQVATTRSSSSNTNNVSHNDFSVCHGRGIVATRNVTAGECLFVTAPTVHANVKAVEREWNEKYCHLETLNSSTSSSSCHREGGVGVETACEQVLVRAMQQAIHKKDTAVAQSFLALLGGNQSNERGTVSMDRLLGNDHSLAPLLDDPPTRCVDEKDLLQIIRKNAFGPDGLVSYENVEQQWRQQLETLDTTPGIGSFSSNTGSTRPPRLLGIYPLAAMINHSCVANAVRVFRDEIMVVHASANLAAGEEVVWSYLPPTRPYAERRAVLWERHGFECFCERCRAEKIVSDQLWAELDAFSSLNRSYLDISNMYGPLSVAVKRVEDKILPHTSLSNELRRYLRVGLTPLYINYLNTSLMTMPTADKATESERKSHLLNLTTQLHFSFCACNNASTEHLSVRRGRRHIEIGTNFSESHNVSSP
jgi:SET domain